MKKLFAALISLTLLCSCGKSDTVETETAVSETVSTAAQTERTEQITETASQVTEEETAAVQTEAEQVDYEYQPPQEVLNAYFYSEDIEAKIECKPILDDELRDVFNDQEAIDEVYSAVTENLPQEIADNIFNNIQPPVGYGSSEGYRIKNVSYMKFDLNADGTEDYYLYVDITDESMSVMGNFHFERVFIADGDSFKPIKIPSFNDSRISCLYILSTRTNGVKDIFAFHNSNKPLLEYDGVSAYGGAAELDEMHTFLRGKILPNNILHINLNISVIDAPVGEYYAVMKFADNPYMKNSLLYTCYPDGTPRTYTETPRGEYNDFSPAIEGYDFYIELNEDKIDELDLEDPWGLYDDFDLLEIKYIKAE